MKYLGKTSLAVAHVVTQWPAPRMTLVAKGRYQLRPDGPATLHEEPPRLGGDLPFDGLPQRLRRSTDLAPFKPKADVMVVGCAPAPGKTPTLELGDHRFTAPSASAVEPFAPLAHDAPPRFAKLGTYDERWVKERWPWFPEDFDAGYFNAAPPALQVDYPAGDEPLVLRQMLPGQSRLASSLPGVRPRCFLDERSAEGPRFREIRLALDTVFVDVTQESVELVWRGICDVSDEDAREVERILWVEERLADPPRPIADYEQVLRLADLPKPRTASAGSPLEARPGNDNEPSAAEVSEREQALLDELRERLEDLRAPAEVLALVGKAERLADAMEILKGSVDHDPEKAKALVADAEEKLRARLREAGHEIPERPEGAPPATEGPAPWSRERVEIASREAESMAGADLSGLDLSGLDLSGSDLGGAFLTGANLDGAKLYGANLADAVLPGARLEGAVFGLAKLPGANLMGVSAKGADFKNAVLSDAVFDEADLVGASFDEVEAKGASFRKAKLDGAVFRSATLVEARFVTAILHDASFEGADLTNATLRAARGEKVSFRGARIAKMRAGDGAILAQADLTEAQGDGAIFMDADLREAKLGRASLRRADLSRALLEGADLSGANCENADFTKSDLRRATLFGGNFGGARFTKAQLDRADARNANFYEAELWLATRRGLKLDGAHVAASKLEGETHV